MKTINNLIPFDFDVFFKDTNIKLFTKDGDIFSVVKFGTDNSNNVIMIGTLYVKDIGPFHNIIYNTNGKCLTQFVKGNSDLCFINVSYEFEPYDRVIVANPNGFWHCSLFSNYDIRDANNVKAIDITGKSFTYCVPFDGNESLIGTIK